MVSKQRTARTYTITAPIRGLNGSDPITLMDPSDALVLDNVICRQGWVESRPGYANHSPTLAAGNVHTIIPYVPTFGDARVFAAALDSIYEVTTAGTATLISSGHIGAEWSHTQVSNQAGNYLLMVNGEATGRGFDGTTWSDWGISGVASSSLSQVTVWKRRVWAVQKNSFKAWYLAADAIAGAATSFNFSGIFKQGGSLLAILTWSIDGGDGIDDYFLAVTTMGEVAVYRGTDPASDMGLVGVYFIGVPLGKRFYTSFGPDLVLLTTQGVISASKFISVTNPRTFLSDKARTFIDADIRTYGALTGWEMVHVAPEKLLLIQVPGVNRQWVMNTQSGAWSKLMYGVAKTWGVAGGMVFAGGGQVVYKMFFGGTDPSETPITWTIVPAFTYMKAPSQLKQLTLGRLVLESEGIPAIQQVALTDFNLNLEGLTATAGTAVQRGSYWGKATWGGSVWGLGSTAGSVGSTWGTAIWGMSTWGTTDVVGYRPWQVLSGMGHSVTQAIRGTSTGTVNRLLSIDYVYERGGVM